MMKDMKYEIRNMKNGVDRGKAKRGFGLTHISFSIFHFPATERSTL